jgi:hypothetical protein
MQVATTKITIIATTMEATNTPFRQSMSSGTGKELSYRSYSRNCYACGAGGTALGPIVCQAKITMSLTKCRFLLSISLHQATDSVSRSREEITVETPSPRMLTPYKASAISIVRFWCVITSNWLVARSSS